MHNEHHDVSDLLGFRCYHHCSYVDESFAVCHSKSSGMLGMVNHGRNTNNSQFYITLKPSPWMDKQYVAFG